MASFSNPYETFKEEVRDLLQIIEHSLIILEDNPGDIDSIQTIFRALHTIKGSGTMFELNDLVQFTHTLESIFESVRDGIIPIDTNLINLMLQSRDCIQSLVFTPNDSHLNSVVNGLLLQFSTYLPRDPKPEESRMITKDSFEPTQSHPKTYRIVFNPKKDIWLNGANPLLLLKELKDLGTNTVLGYSETIPDLENLNPTSCYFSWDILLTTGESKNSLLDIFIFVDDKGVVSIDTLDDPEEFEINQGYKRLGEILVERGFVDSSSIDRAKEEQGFLGTILVNLGLISEEKVDAALNEQKFVRQVQENRKPSLEASTIKVNSEKLEELVNLVGEFVALQARMNLLSQYSENQELRTATENMDGLVRQFRNISLELQMVPIHILFSGFRRLIRDVSTELGKNVQFIVEGTETELDKNIIEAIKDPLVHILRNCIDHGIELPEIREKLGKNPKGTIGLTAYYSGAHVVIEIKDDGAGLNKEQILQKAFEKGLISKDAKIPESEIFELIFTPGFSTAESTTNISGRGIGMDVVRRNLETVNGNIKIESQTGVGTTLKLRIPLTLAIVEGLLARIHSEQYLINLSYILECIEWKKLNIVQKEKMFEFRGHIIPYLDLRTFFYNKNDTDQGQMIVVAVEDHKIGLIVDEILNPYQSIIKPLGPLFEKAKGVSGAIILGNGNPAFMLDVDLLTRLSKDENSFQFDPHQSDQKQGRTDSEHGFEGILFLLGSETYTIDLNNVEEVLEWSGATPVPRTPEVLLGIVNVRGRIIPVLSLRTRLKLPPDPITRDSRLLVLNTTYDDHQLDIGILVDKVQGITKIENEQKIPLPEINLTALKNQHFDMKDPILSGLAQLDQEKICIIVNGQEIVSSSYIDQAYHFVRP